MNELADGNPDEQEEVEDEEDREGSSGSTEDAEGEGELGMENSNTITADALEREEQEGRAALDSFSRCTNLGDSVALAIEEVTPNEPSVSNTTPLPMITPDAINLIDETLEKGKRPGATLHVAETAPLMILRCFHIFGLRNKVQAASCRSQRGAAAGSSLLQVDTVHKEVLAWLHRQVKGSITPPAFTHAVTNDILPRCGYLEEITISNRTARRWLNKCGYTLKITKKGVYEDGHEQEDVIVYRREVFLPLMSEKDYRKPNWLGPGQQVLPGKGMGRLGLVHVSDFITNATPNGRLTYVDTSTGTSYDARVIIKPSSKGDPRWDTKQLLVQVAHAIEVHSMAFGPDIEACFLFDQSSAHASNGNGALNAFDMNKADGAKRKVPVYYKDTVVPMDVPNVEMRGKVQSLMMGDQPKGTERVLSERGIFPGKKRAKCNPRCMDTAVDCCYARILHNQRDFKEQKSALETLVLSKGQSAVFLPKFYCECNPIEMYWGYSKYLYRQVQKGSLEQAEKEVVKALEGVGLDKIKRYVNRSYRFMDAYRQV